MPPRLHLFPDPPPGSTPLAAVLVPLFPDREGGLRVVLTKRPDTMPTHAGHLSFPGGRPQPEDAGPLATALREAEEEVGIPPGDVEILGYLHPVDTVELALLVVPVVGRLAAEPVLRPDPREVAGVLTPLLDELAEEGRWRWELWRGRRLWFYDLDGEVLWGATAAMVRSLLGLAL